MRTTKIFCDVAHMMHDLFWDMWLLYFSVYQYAQIFTDDNQNINKAELPGSRNMFILRHGEDQSLPSKAKSVINQHICSFAFGSTNPKLTQIWNKTKTLSAITVIT